MVLVQQAVIYALPLVVLDPGLDVTSAQVIVMSGIGVTLFLACLSIGWSQGREAGALKTARGRIQLGGRRMEQAFPLAAGLLAVALLFQIGARTGLIYQLLPGGLEGLFSVIRTFASVAGMVGALFGGLIVGGRRHLALALPFWTLVVAICALSIADVLLSAATGTVLAALIGLALGKQRVPVAVLVVTFGVLAFLNLGKFVMRERHWGEETNTTTVTLAELPGFYAEWMATSSALLLGGGNDFAEGDEEGQSMLDRIDNFQNMTFVVQATENRNIPLLWGETYMVIPKLFIPRVLWANKPGVHEGQALLNLHFGRQATIEQTERTYIAWGLLPEAIGNFGLWGGSIGLGLAMGFGMGWLERVSRRKSLLSVEGMVLSCMMLLTVASFEMVASVYLTSMFQALIAVTLGGLLVRWFFGPPMQQRRSKRSHSKA